VENLRAAWEWCGSLGLLWLAGNAKPLRRSSRLILQLEQEVMLVIFDTLIRVLCGVKEKRSTSPRSPLHLRARLRFAGTFGVLSRDRMVLRTIQEFEAALEINAENWDNSEEH
jgi:hypothetical protein